MPSVYSGPDNLRDIFFATDSTRLPPSGQFFFAPSLSTTSPGGAMGPLQILVINTAPERPLRILQPRLLQDPSKAFVDGDGVKHQFLAPPAPMEPMWILQGGVASSWAEFYWPLRAMDQHTIWREWKLLRASGDLVVCEYSQPYPEIR